MAKKIDPMAEMTAELWAAQLAEAWYEECVTDEILRQGAELANLMTDRATFTEMPFNKFALVVMGACHGLILAGMQVSRITPVEQRELRRVLPHLYRILTYDMNLAKPSRRRKPAVPRVFKDAFKKGETDAL